MASKITQAKAVAIVLHPDKLTELRQELTNVREDMVDNKYIQEAIKVLAADGLRSAIGAYWNAVVDDLRRKIIHRSLDLFNKEIRPKREIKSYEDFQNYTTELELIDGAYKIGVIGWEAHKLLHQARETRNIFYGHPDSTNPTLFKVFNMIADCNRYVLSEDYPLVIIDVNEYILTMDSDSYDKNDIAVEQAFIDLPEIYKNEMSNRLFTIYLGDNASTRLRSSIEFSYPILWKVLPKELRQQIGKRFDKLVVEGNKEIIEKATTLLAVVDGMRYVSTASRKILYDPYIKELESNLDNWSAESEAAKEIQRLGSTIPSSLIERLVRALTLTYVGYKGGSAQYSRTSFYSNGAAPRITAMFELFDNNSADAFVETVKTNSKLRERVRYADQLNRLRNLGQILLNKPEIRKDTKDFLEILVDPNKIKKLNQLLPKLD